MAERRNINRGYMKLRVWQDARELYALTCRIFRSFPHELRRVTSNQIASVDSAHRNIAEGCCRRTLNEYLQHLNIALGSAGEAVSGIHVYRSAEQIQDEDFQQWDALAYRLENGLKKLVESLQAKRVRGEWSESFILRESNGVYGSASQE